MPRYSVNPAPSDSLARGQPEDAGYKPDALHHPLFGFERPTRAQRAARSGWGISSAGEHWLCKPRVEGSIPSSSTASSLKIE